MISKYEIKSLEENDKVSLETYANWEDDEQKKYFEEILFKGEQEKFVYGTIEEISQEHRNIYVLNLKYLLNNTDNKAIDFTEMNFFDSSKDSIINILSKDAKDRVGKNVIANIKRIEKDKQNTKEKKRTNKQKYFTCENIVNEDVYCVISKLRLDDDILKKELVLTKDKNYADILKLKEGIKDVNHEMELESIKNNKITKALEHNDIASQIKYIGNYIFSEYHLNFSDELIENMLLAVHSKQLIMLAGRPGSGKTSFAKFFSESVGEYDIISVQSNWLDKGDLLGYYNPIEQRYNPSIFLEKLVSLIERAKKNKDKLYFMCLDEMNLSIIEYYFADFLSAWDANSDCMTISLFSRSAYEEKLDDLFTKIENLGINIERNIKLEEKENQIDKILASSMKGSDTIKFNELKRAFNNLKRYQYEFIIPENLKFIGTINIDSTTKDLSPKVIDRAYFIRLEGSSVEDRKNERIDEQGRRYIKYLKDKGEIAANSDIKQDCEKIAGDLMEKCNNSGLLIINNRFKVASENITKFLCDVVTDKKSFSTDKFRAYLIAGLIFPKVSMKEKAFKQFLKEISVDDKNELLNSVIKIMESNVDDYVTYFRG